MPTEYLEHEGTLYEHLTYYAVPDDLRVTITLSGDNPDWPLVDLIWAVLVDLWSAVPWDEMSGFEIDDRASADRTE